MSKYQNITGRISQQPLHAIMISLLIRCSLDQMLVRWKLSKTHHVKRNLCCLNKGYSIVFAHVSNMIL
ncbi:hypothetical protein Peur_060767 [Populus x canadensis]